MIAVRSRRPDASGPRRRVRKPAPARVALIGYQDQGNLGMGYLAAVLQRHGYKGAFELAATVDYLFGYDATTGVAEDWMYEQVAQRYLLDDDVAEFMSRSNPWAARAIAERLLEAADRGMWASPESDTISGIRDRYLALEGELEEAGA
jgi:cobaltochelatase CobN